jgi:hypothetical protein
MLDFLGGASQREDSLAHIVAKVASGPARIGLVPNLNLNLNLNRNLNRNLNPARLALRSVTAAAGD